MRALLIYPIFPPTFWSYDKILELVNRKVLLPPLGLITVASILPQEWEFKLVDRNIRPVSEAEWAWADVVIMSAMIVQKDDLLSQIKEAKKRGKLVAVGGPYPTSVPHEPQEAGVDFLILDEGEITLPMFVEAIEKGEKSGIFRTTEKPDVTITPVPRFDLLEFDAYDSMSVQFSRGCPFQCEFCDIIVLYGRKPRTKTPQQLLKELDYLYELGWRRSVFMVDDNFIGNKRNVKLLLKALKIWQQEKQYPFRFNTEASVDLADDDELMQLMVDCYFDAVFLGIETPDEDSLQLTKKFQNTRSSLADAVDKIIRIGLRPMAGFIIGFDGEKKGAGDRIVRFAEQVGIPTTTFAMLQALPNTALWHRLEKEGRLREGKDGNINQTTLMNFVPTRPVEDIANEYVDAFWRLYDPHAYLDRIYHCFLKLGAPKAQPPAKLPSLVDLKALAIVVWRQGIKRDTRWKFWHHLFSIIKHNPAVWEHYLTLCAHNEHFMEYREIVKVQIETQLKEYLSQDQKSLITC
ncbi:MAG: B12-binding domain-containing radical SAM protein [Cyanobacteria bacterium]|nr:B12-binding domain-containing radical SAM protein [Cyanobacteria bacterium CG_2015-16_32_12]NCO78261.1 B12-binding domain-containing radical SAM protein [Cyanobacteria bacterium CG_2015-22_32_23]NCQ02898.1 B12-binding domain-containing radical SAM protein [Cyanobacteria bacterium CG_2015-09_32_10]NCQ42765.1 B12-binding domain-containing radical SAM protein [Cyanobacteria bacterium CG_2015-04_32_10]NCS83487.1 B12-binding domain-containing radical SAM protein [Cyanobacteria bacterium CG_2015-0